MRVSDLFGFRRDIFFEGAVQLGWLENAPGRAALAASSYVFHGPEFHAVSQGDHSEELRRSPLVDTASFFHRLVGLVAGAGPEGDHNPFGLAIAGYGTGKSHLGVALATVLGGYPGAEAVAVLDNLERVAPGLGETCRKTLDKAAAPVLVVALDGMGDFHLGSQLYRKIVRTLQHFELDLTPVDELSPRFKLAAAFVERNYDLRHQDFAAQLGKPLSKEELKQALALRDDRVFKCVDSVYREANGSSIPATGQESPEALITTVCDSYCGPGKPFSSMFILFDEFGRYLEFTADKPHIAGDAGLQQMYQGVQTASDQGRCCYFLGLIQFDLTSYLAQLKKREAHNLMRFVPRFEQGSKTLLSSNLETLFASLIERRKPEEVRQLLDGPVIEQEWCRLHAVMSRGLPNFDRWEVWRDYERFRQVIVAGCWPLHPTTVWFLSRLSNLVQNRSALSFVEKELTRIGDCPARGDDGAPYCVYPVDMVLGDMLGEILEAEKRTHATIADEFATVRARYAGKWTTDQERVLAAVVVAQKMEAHVADQAAAHEFLATVAGMTPTAFARTMKEVIETFGVAEWNDDLKRYDMIIDAVPRSHFALFLRKRASEVDERAVLDYFRLTGIDTCDLIVPESSFADDQCISTTDWKYGIFATSPASLSDDINRAVDAWRDATAPDVPKGQVLYVLVPSDEDVVAVGASFQKHLDDALDKHGAKTAPIFGVLLLVGDNEFLENLARLVVLERKLTNEEKNRYGQFLDSERATIRARLRQMTADEIQQRRFQLPRGIDITPTRLNSLATGIFEAVYPRAFAFEVDGFSTTRGNAAKDCAVMVRAWVGRQIDSNWITTQQMSVQNRARRLFVRIWQVVSDDFDILHRPGYQPVRAILDDLGARLERDGSLDLYAVFKELIAPPYGMNTASAGLLVAIFLGANNPMKSISDETGPIGVESWLTRAFQKGHLIEPERLKGTRAVFVPAAAVDKWSQLIKNWYLEPSHRGNLRFAAEAQELARQFPAPEGSADNLGLLRERASTAKEQIESLESQVEDWYRSAHRGTDGRDLERVISVAGKALSQRQHMTKDQGKWAAEDEKLVENFLDLVRKEVQKYFDEWARELRPVSTDKIVDFQEKLKLAARVLERLGMPEQKKVLEQRNETALARFQLLAENQYVLSSAQAFLKSNVGNFSTPSQTLKQWLKDGQGLAGQLDDIKRLEPAAVQLARDLEERLGALQRIVEEQRARLDTLAEKTISSFDELRETLEEVEQARAATEGTDADQDLVDELRRQLKQALEDWEPLQKFEGTFEELTNLVAARIEARERETQESGADPYWSFEDIYTALATELKHLLTERAARWLERVIPDEGAIEGWTLQRCRDAKRQLDDHPAYLEGELKSRSDEASGRLKKRIEQIEKEERETRARVWVEQNVPAREQLNSFGVDDCRMRLSRVREVPDFLSPIDMACVAEVRSLLQERLDELDFSQLVDRAKRLPVHRRRELLTALQNALQEL